MAISNKCTETTFILTGQDRAESVEGVDSFRYLVQLIHQSYGDWSEVLSNILKVRQVWGVLGKLLWW